MVPCRYKQIEDSMPQEFYARAKDKYHYRYPRGESYQVSQALVRGGVRCLP